MLDNEDSFENMYSQNLLSAKNIDKNHKNFSMMRILKSQKNKDRAKTVKKMKKEEIDEIKVQKLADNKISKVTTI